MTRFLIAITSLLVLGASVQGFKTDQSENSLPATPSHALKKLMYILSEPKFNQKNNVQTKEIDKIIEYIGELRSMGDQMREERDLLKDISKKVKDIIDKIKSPFQKLSNKIKDGISQLTKPIQKLFGGGKKM